MFTLRQITDAHSSVKSGADFPAYIQRISKLGVTFYEAFVTDGHTDYYGDPDYKIAGHSKYAAQPIAEEVNLVQFRADLLAHQQGKTDYLTFCDDCARSGIEKWRVSLENMTCTYFDKSGNQILVEVIPQ